MNPASKGGGSSFFASHQMEIGSFQSSTWSRHSDHNGRTSADENQSGPCGEERHPRPSLDIGVLGAHRWSDDALVVAEVCHASSNSCCQNRRIHRAMEESHAAFYCWRT